MKHVSTSTGDQLTHALRMLGVNFILGGKDTNESLHKHPARLISALAQSDEARLRLSLIPLFLEHPEYASLVRDVAKGINPSARLTLQCYYSAAVWLQRKYHLESTPLPDHFSKDLNLTLVDEPEENLRLLAKRHRELSRSFTNWFGTYMHAAQVWRKGLEYQKG
jgi:hypothetical protein